jgi:hypothetical protein
MSAGECQTKNVKDYDDEVRIHIFFNYDFNLLTSLAYVF